MAINFDVLRSAIHSIDDSVRYWLVRTEGGALYRSFLRQGLVAIGYPEVSVKRIEDWRKLACTVNSRHA